MNGLAVHIGLTGIPDAQAMLGELVALGEDLTPLMEAIGVYLVGSTVERFETETEPDGTPWMPSWRARDEGGQTLTRTGRLKQSFDSRADAVSVEWGTNVSYAAPLHFGAVIRPKNAKALAFVGSHGALVFAGEVILPARPMVGFTDQDSAAVVMLAADFIEQRAAGAAGGAP
ncbi:hypothetical protein sos41_31310 [Alphaproteobacteria bacterium SO-S41]|nr:hypothetical protein sos41_31310 [Alphaproteobacteria bacterium SO-S41]